MATNTNVRMSLDSENQEEINSTPMVTKKKVKKKGAIVHTSKKKRRLSSAVWVNYDIMSEEDEDGNLMCKCKKCGTIYNAESKQGTGNLIRHVKACKMRTYRDVGQTLLEKTSSGLQSRLVKFDVDEFRELLAMEGLKEFVAMEGLNGVNQHILPDQVSSQNCRVIDNSTINTTVETVEVPMVETQLRTDDHEIGRERLNGANPSTLSNFVQKSGSSCSFVVKATHKEDTVRFDSFSTTIVEIREEVAANLELELGKFKIKYEDSDKEWMLMTTNEHLKYARNLLDSSGSNILRLLIIDS